LPSLASHPKAWYTVEAVSMKMGGNEDIAISSLSFYTSRLPGGFPVFSLSIGFSCHIIGVLSGTVRLAGAIL
jgi:hypothetical protein